MAENAGLGDGVSFADLPFKMEDGTTANARDFLDDLDADAEADAVLAGSGCFRFWLYRRATSGPKGFLRFKEY
jgi:hypothetical protein